MAKKILAWHLCYFKSRWTDLWGVSWVLEEVMWTLLFGSSRCKKQQNPTTEGILSYWMMRLGSLTSNLHFLGSLTSPFSKVERRLNAALRMFQGQFGHLSFASEETRKQMLQTESDVRNIMEKSILSMVFIFHHCIVQTAQTPQMTILGSCFLCSGCHFLMRRKVCTLYTF